MILTIRENNINKILMVDLFHPFCYLYTNETLYKKRFPFFPENKIYKLNALLVDIRTRKIDIFGSTCIFKKNWRDLILELNQENIIFTQEIKIRSIHLILIFSNLEQVNLAIKFLKQFSSDDFEAWSVLDIKIDVAEFLKFVTQNNIFYGMPHFLMNSIKRIDSLDKFKIKKQFQEKALFIDLSGADNEQIQNSIYDFTLSNNVKFSNLHALKDKRYLSYIKIEVKHSTIFSSFVEAILTKNYTLSQ